MISFVSQYRAGSDIMINWHTLGGGGGCNPKNPIPV